MRSTADKSGNRFPRKWKHIPLSIKINVIEIPLFVNGNTPIKGKILSTFLWRRLAASDYVLSAIKSTVSVVCDHRQIKCSRLRLEHLYSTVSIHGEGCRMNDVCRHEVDAHITSLEIQI